MSPKDFYQKISSGKKPYLVAEIGLNHNGDYDTAQKMIEKAAYSGADGVKFQTINAEKLVAPAPEKDGIFDDPIAFFKKFQFSFDQYKSLRGLATGLGMDFFSTPFDEESADMLVKVGVSALKISSGDLTHTPLIRHLARKKLPLILSTGMADFEEIDQAVIAAEEEGCDKLIILHCAFCHPSKFEDMNLLAMAKMISRYKYPVGLSDHTPGDLVPIMAGALGARIVEKHFTLDPKMEGPDQAYSMDPEQFLKMSHSIKLMPEILGDGIKKAALSENNLLRLARRSLHAIKDLPINHQVKREDIVVLRPADGLKPDCLDKIVGKRLKKAKKAKEPLFIQDFQ